MPDIGSLRGVWFPLTKRLYVRELGPAGAEDLGKSPPLFMDLGTTEDVAPSEALRMMEATHPVRDHPADPSFQGPHTVP